ncbi:MAG: DNA-binding response regulator [Planctomycetota bacterium]|nr:MAG: DNA-binding response regulator [Planctomycetota bacterium]REJ92449.1 MAG: DNA-binding response regulator [Planctomycetota bacterium]REK22910.1 MAG: DNA-binding response regulator [Planctomycetota bacterium]REK37390.1 MAG: DNA-binding response regulator [Planctomycetota bacterium]
MKVLLAEDDKRIRDGLAEILLGEGYVVVEAVDGEEAERAFRAERPDFICLDIMMPKRSGFDVCRAIRAEDSQIPIIFISAKSEEIDKVLGLELGADDFIVKPFGVKEVVARIRAVTRRCHARASGNACESFVMGDLEVFPKQLRAARDGETIELSLRDVKILQLLFEHRGEALDRPTIFRHGWGEQHFPNSRTLDQHISQLRKRVERVPAEPQLIRTVHGVGYRYDA